MNLEGFINVDGFVTVERGAATLPGEGNGWLQTGVAIACDPRAYLRGNPGVPPAVMFDRCTSPGIPLLYRSPHKKNKGDEEKVDDYFGAFRIAYQWGEEWAAELLAYLEKNGWKLNPLDLQTTNDAFDFSRFPSFVPLLRLAAKKKLPFWDSFLLAISIVADGLAIDKADGNMRAYCRITIAEKESVACAWAAWYWRSRIKKKYGSVGASFAGYFGNNHPLSSFEETNGTSS